MARIEGRQYRLIDDRSGLGKVLYRMFLLSTLFAVLWSKGYLWTIFVIALLFWLYDTFVIGALTAQPIDPPEADQFPEPDEEEDVPKPSPRRGRTRWKWRPEDSP
jgi:hypothetical protein